MDISIGLPNTVPGAGCDELTFFPTSTDPQQVDLLADAVGLPVHA
jgi:hypothetical protein